jgi:DNA replication protein
VSTFAGFPDGKTRLTPIPDLFFTRLLVDIDDLDELKVLCFMFYYLNQQVGYPRYMTMTELASEGMLLSALQHGDDEPVALLVERLHAAVERCVARGSLLSLHVDEGESETVYVLANTALGRAAVREVMDGELVLERPGAPSEPHVERQRPTIFSLYEQNIGLLSPLLAEQLLEAERDYPAVWIEDAFRIAVEQNARNWRYVEAILRRWAEEGRDDTGPSGEHSRRRRRPGQRM